MSMLQDPWFQTGKRGVAIIAGCFSWMRRSKSVVIEAKPAAKLKRHDHIEREAKLECYHAFVRGMCNRRMSYLVLDIIRSSPHAINEEDIGVKVHALASKEWSPSGIHGVIMDLLKGDFIEFAGIPNHYRCRPNTNVLLADLDAMHRNCDFVSDEEDRLICFEGILKYLAESNTLRYSLQALRVAGQPMSIEEVFLQARSLSQKQISLNGVQNLLEDLRSDPFVDEVQDGIYRINENGQVLLESIAIRSM